MFDFSPLRARTLPTPFGGGGDEEKCRWYTTQAEPASCRREPGEYASSLALALAFRPPKW